MLLVAHRVGGVNDGIVLNCPSVCACIHTGVLVEAFSNQLAVEFSSYLCCCCCSFKSFWKQPYVLIAKDVRCSNRFV